MLLRTILASLTLISVQFLPPTASAQGAGTPDRIFDLPYTLHELENGLRIIVVETGYPDIVNLQIVVNTGVRNETDPGRSGFAHFFEHMMYRGTDKYPTASYVNAMKEAGAEWNASTVDDYTRFYMTFTKADLERMIELEADRFQNLNYSIEGFRTEALAIKGEYLADRSNPLLAAFDRIRQLAFKKHPYAHTTIGLLEDIETMPEQYDYSREFFDRWYRPENATIVVVGDVESDVTIDLVEKYWGSWQRGEHTARIPPEPPAQGPAYTHMQWGSATQPWLLIGFRSPAFVPGENDVPALRLMNAIYFSASSDLYQKLVIDEQLIDSLGTDFPLNLDPNLNLIYMQLTDESHAAAVERAVLETLDRARKELVGADLLRDTKSNLRYSFAGELDRSASIGDTLSSFAAFGRSPEPLNDLYASFARLTPDDVRSFARRYFTNANRVTVSLSASPEMEGVGSQELAESTNSSAGTRGDVEAGDAPEMLSDTAIVSRVDATPVRIIAKRIATSPLVDVSILVHSGAAADPAGKEGLAALTAAMIADGGTKAFSIQDINAAMYPLAAEFEAAVDKEMTRLSGQVHRDNLERWYELVRSQLLNPAWDAADLERLKDRQSTAIRSGLVAGNDEELAKEVLYADIYGTAHAYGSLNLGNSDTVQALTIDDVRDFYRQNYVVNNMTIGLAGGYPPEFVKKLSKDMLSLPAGEKRSVQLGSAPEILRSRATIVAKDTDAVAVSFGFPIELKRGDPDWVALWLARSYLGEHRSDNSHLFQRIRELRGLNYGDYAYIEYFPDGMFRLQPDTNKGRKQQIFQIWIRPLENNNDAHFTTRVAHYELNKLVADGLTETQFEDTRAFLSRFVSLITDGQSRQIGYALDSDFYGTEDFAEYVRAELAALTLADVNRVIHEHLDVDAMQFVFVTRDADDLHQRLIRNRVSRPTYPNEQSEAILEEDREIEGFDLGIAAAQVRIVAADDVFR